MPDSFLTHAQLKTPKAAAIAGIVFSLLLLSILWLLRTSIPADPLDPGAWLATDTRGVTVALNLVPFAGVAFLWFIGVLRDRLAQLEDRFFATVFFGSGLLFLAMLFTAAAIIGALGRFCFHAAGTNEFSHLPLRARRFLHHRERVRDPNGRRIYDFHFNRRDPYRHCPALDCLSRIFAGTVPSDGKLFHQLEFRSTAVLGLPDQRLHPDRQSRRQREGRWRLS